MMNKEMDKCCRAETRRANLRIIGTICKGVTNRVLGSNERGNIVAVCHRKFLWCIPLTMVVTIGTTSS